MSRRGIKIFIGIWSAVLVIALVLLVLFFRFGKVGWGGNNMSSWNFGNRSEFVTVKEETVTSQVKNLSLEWISGQLNVKKSEDASVRIVQTARADFPQDQLFTLSENGGKLSVEDGRGGFRISFFNWNSAASDLTVYLPEQEFENFKIRTTSADLEAPGLKSGKIDFGTVSGVIRTDGSFGEAELSTTSGDMDLSGTVEGKLGLYTTSGRISLGDLTADRLEAKTTSGDLTSDSLRVNTVSAKTVSGVIRLEGSVNELDANTTSGDVMVMTDVPMTRMNIGTVSGYCSLDMPDNGGFTAKFSKVSGKFKTDFPTTQDGDTYVYGDGSAQFQVKTTSGDFSLNKNG